MHHLLYTLYHMCEKISMKPVVAACLPPVMPLSGSGALWVRWKKNVWNKKGDISDSAVLIVLMNWSDFLVQFSWTFQGISFEFDHYDPRVNSLGGWSQRSKSLTLTHLFFFFFGHTIITIKCTKMSRWIKLNQYIISAVILININKHWQGTFYLNRRLLLSLTSFCR